MKSRVLQLLLVATAAQLSTATAALTVYTSFEGSASSTPNDLGFSSSTWTTTAAGGTDSSATFTAGNIDSLPTAYLNSGFVNSGNFLQTSGTPTFQTLSTGISVGSASTTYFSFLYRVTTSVGQGGGLSFFNGTAEQFQIGMGAGNPLGSLRIAQVTGGSSQTNTPATSYVSGTDTAWIVGQIVTTAGDDSISINVYTGDDMVGPEGVWDTTNTFAIASDLTSIRFNSPNAQQFDEFRMGTTYASVIPEPSSVLLSGLGMLGLAFRRSRSVRA